MSKHIKVAIGAAVLALALIAASRFLFSRESLEAAGRRIHAAIRSGRAEDLKSYIAFHESQAMDLGGATLDHLIREYVQPTLAGLTPVGPLSVNPDAAYEQCWVTQSFRRPDGELVKLVVVLAEGDDGPVAPYLVSHIVLFVFESKYRTPADSEPYAMALARSWQQGALQDQDLLSSLGITKVVRHRREGVVDWAEFAKIQETRVQRMIAAKAQPPREGAK